LRYRGSQKCSVPGQFTQLFCYLKDEFIRSKNGFMCFGWFVCVTAFGSQSTSRST
jgi:hypothetical protein